MRIGLTGMVEPQGPGVKKELNGICPEKSWSCPGSSVMIASCDMAAFDATV